MNFRLPIRRGLRRAVPLFLCSMIVPAALAHPEDFDLVVYGGTSGGVTAAVQGARMGKRVALVSPTKRMGGLSSSGLGWTDLGDIKILGGLSRDFYHRVYLYYSQQLNWGSLKSMSAQGGSAFNATYQTASIFEPKVAESVFDDMLSEAGVPVFQARLNLVNGVVMTGKRITGLRMEDGRTFRGKMFIDASYEGDVMAGAGVTFTVGRDPNAQYGESISGVRSNTSGHQMPGGVSAYVVKGDPASGLLPGLETGLAPDGTGDEKLQAFCFRMCLTDVAANRIPIEQPPGYDEKDFELVLRAVEAGQRTFFKLDRMPNGKTDSNNTGGVSCDYIGRNYGRKPSGESWNWATLNHDERDALAKEHEYWQRGMVWTLQNHQRVKALVPNGIHPGWGLPKDEFTDNGNWPFQLYVREARRMVSDYVMTQKNCNRTEVVLDSVGMGAYTMDSHNVQRYVSNGQVRNEGDVQVPIPGPYPISYRSIVPRRGECENLLVPWCLSATHMAFGSIRMEPVFMTLGQSSGTAAVMAINENLAVQDVPYERLAMKLRADGQSLILPAAEIEASGTVADNEHASTQITGAWVASSSVAGHYGNNYLSDDATGKGEKSVRLIPSLPQAGTYQVQLRWTSHANRASNVPVKVFHKNGVFETQIDQRSGGSAWVTLGSFPFEAGSSGSVLIENAGTTGYVVVDSAQWLLPGVAANVVASVSSFMPEVTRGSPVPGEFVFSRSGSTDSPLTLNLEVGGAGAMEASPALPVTVTIPAGAREASATFTAPKSSLPQGAMPVTVTILPSSAYVVGPLSPATVTIVDDGFDRWRKLRFSPSELANPLISGRLADPDGNGAGNFLEFFVGSPQVTPQLEMIDGEMVFSFRRSKAAAGVKMRVFESENMVDWQETQFGPRPAHFEDHGDFNTIGLPLPGDVSQRGTKRFYQLRIE